jgi:alpha-N-arabinofuranosidase
LAVTDSAISSREYQAVAYNASKHFPIAFGNGKMPCSNMLHNRGYASRWHSIRGLLLVSLLVALSFSCFAQKAEVTINIDASKPASFKIPRSVFGAFLEPIGNSIYNGLWAEILENPSFEDNLWSAPNIAKMLEERPELERSSGLALPLPWEPLYDSQGARYAPAWGDAANSTRSLLLMSLPGQETGVKQRVYLPVHRVLRFVGSVYVKHLSGPPELNVSIRRRDHPEEIFASQKLVLSGTTWRKYTYSLEVPSGKIASLGAADYVIALNHETRVLLDLASLMPADNIDGMDPEMIEMARAMKPSVVRFGGNFTSAYNWRDGIGSRDKRVSMLNIAWGMPEYNQFGTGEFLRFCQLVGAEPQIALNLGTGTPADAAAWVAYVNAHWGDHHGGLLWELGNELWGTFQVGYPVLSRVADRTKLFINAVHAIDPRARLIATGGDPDTFREWNQAQLTNQGFDYLSTHFVVPTGSVEQVDPPADFIAKSTFALPVELGRKLREIHQQIQDSPAHEQVKTAFTEWLFWAQEGNVPRYDNMAGAIGTGGLLNMLLQNADIVPISDMTGIVEFGGIWKKRGRVFGTPAYWVFRMYSNSNAVTPVAATTNSQTYNIRKGEKRLPSIDNVPYLDVVPALNTNGDKLTLFCVNRDLTRDLRTNVVVTGFSPKSSASVQSVYGDNILDKNDETQPEHLRAHEITIQVGANGFTYEFRHESVTVIELQR